MSLPKKLLYCPLVGHQDKYVLQLHELHTSDHYNLQKQINSKNISSPSIAKVYLHVLQSITMILVCDIIAYILAILFGPRNESNWFPFTNCITNFFGQPLQHLALNSTRPLAFPPNLMSVISTRSPLARNVYASLSMEDAIMYHPTDFGKKANKWFAVVDPKTCHSLVIIHCQTWVQYFCSSQN